jgi:predicted phosphodiesterase
MLDVDDALGCALGREPHDDPCLAVAPVEAGRPRLRRGALAKPAVGQPAFAQRLVDERVVQAVDRNRDGLRGGDREAVGVLTDGTVTAGRRQHEQYPPLRQPHAAKFIARRRIVERRRSVGSTRVSRLLVFGDLHCDRRHLRGLVERAVEERCDALVSLGDLFYLPRDPEGRRFLRSAGALLRQVSLELLLVDGNHDDAEALARARTRSPAPGPVPLGFHMHHLPAGTRFQLGRLRCLACGGAFSAWSPRAGRDWHRTAARERAALNHLAGGGEIDLLFCHDPRTLEQGAQAHGSFAALAAKLRPALVIYAHQHRPHVSAAEQPALVGLGSFKDGHFSAVVLDSAETGRLVRALRRAQAGAQPEAHR